MHFITHFGNVKKTAGKMGSERVLHGARLTEGVGGSKSIWAMPINGTNTFQKGTSVTNHQMISLKPWRLFLYITRAMTSLLFANAGPVTFKAPASLQPNIALLPAQGYQMSNVEIFTKRLILRNPIQYKKYLSLD